MSCGYDVSGSGRGSDRCSDLAASSSLASPEGGSRVGSAVGGLDSGDSPPVEGGPPDGNGSGAGSVGDFLRSGVRGARVGAGRVVGGVVSSARQVRTVSDRGASSALGWFDCPPTRGRARRRYGTWDTTSLSALLRDFCVAAAPLATLQGFVGVHGVGKTAIVTRLVLRELAAGTRVIANYRITHPVAARDGVPLSSIPLAGWDCLDGLEHECVGDPFSSSARDRLCLWCGGRGWCNGRLCGETCFVSVRNGLIVIDEITGWANSRKWQSFPVGALSRIAQARHAGVRLWWISQREAGTEVSLRAVTQFVWHLAPWLGRLGWIAEAFHPEESSRRDLDGEGVKALKVMRGLHNRTVFEAYDSWGDVATSDELQAAAREKLAAAKRDAERVLVSV